MRDEEESEEKSELEALMEVPAAGWDIFWGTLRNVFANRVSFNAAAAAFYLLLAIIPGMAAIVLIYGTVSNPDDVRSLIRLADGAVPSEVTSVLRDEVERIVAMKTSTWIFVLVLGFAVYCGSNAVGSIITGLNIAHSARDNRKFFPVLAVSVVLAVAGLLFLVAAVGLLSAVPEVLIFFGIGDYAGAVVSILRWPMLVLVMMLWLSVLYRWAPDQKGVRWKWFSWGSLAASVLWIAVSALYTSYVAHFGRYSAVFGSLGAVVVTLIWLYFSAFVALLGEELNVEVKRWRARHRKGIQKG